MRAHCFQHVPFEGAGSIKPWLEKTEYELTWTRFFESAHLPDPKEIDLLVIMGGPMSVNDEEKFPWLISEKQFVRRAIDIETPVLGICLGAQIIASAMGAKVFPNTEKEIGWFPIEGISHSAESLFTFPRAMTVFHWHGETFDLPPGAIRLAKSKACENQAFQFGKSVIGLQFHLEMTPDSVKEIVSNCRDELIPSTFVQTEEEILSQTVSHYQSTNKLMNSVLDFIRKCGP